MNNKTTRSLDTLPGSTKDGNPPRLFFIDNLRIILVILVVLHHVAMVYGASSPFYYVEPPFTNPLAFLVLLVFALVNQSWFMGAFFLLAGYFTPGSFDRKGSGTFFKDRLIRFGLPLIIYTFVINPVTELGMFLMPPEMTGITNPLTWNVFQAMYPGLIGLGPLWFVAILLIFTLGYGIWRILAKKETSQTSSKETKPTYLGIVIFILGLAAVTFLLRKTIPLGKTVSEFPTLAYLPQYLSFFVVGIVAYRRNWFRNLSVSMGWAGFVAALAVSIMLFPLAFSGKMFSMELTDMLGNAMGNGHWQSAVYVLWDSIFAVGICLGLITFFRQAFNREGKLSRILAQQSYAVYILHILVILLIAYLLRGIVLGNLLKFGLAAVIVVPTCFVVAYFVHKIPFASRVL
jgi:peptidoglycan/LPS O-acetylase OafA/YrhL